MFTKEELALRQQGLGGSDIGALLGLSPYKTPYELYLEKTANEPLVSKPSEPIKWGHALEAPIAAMYEQETGQKTEECGRFVHAQHPIFFAHPDRLLVGQKKGLEIKNVGVQNSALWGPTGSNIIPEHYFLQIAHYMYVTGLPEWDVAALIGGNNLRIYTFHHNPTFDAIIEEEGLNFWKNHVEPRIPPEVSFSGSGKDFLRKYYQSVEEKTVSLSEDYLHWKEVYVSSTKLAKEYQQTADLALAHVLKGMETSNQAVLPDGSSFIRKKVAVKGYTVEPNEYVRVDFKEFKPKNPALAEKGE